jgi:hypothetical protein
MPRHDFHDSQLASQFARLLLGHEQSMHLVILADAGIHLSLQI